MAQLARSVQEATDLNVEIAYVDQRYTGEAAAEQAQDFCMELVVAKHTEANKGFVLLPRRWVVERSFAWAGRFRRLARDYERMPQTLAGCTMSPSSASCSAKPCPSSALVHYSL